MGRIIQGIDLEDFISFLSRKNKVFQKHILKEMEKIIVDPEQYREVRKLILDSTNNFVRAVAEVIYEDYEKGE
jgi:hypothetical protein